MPDQPLAILFRTAGTNCDAELARAFELAGARVEMVHLDTLIADPSILGRADLVGFPGGFSYGDDVAAGRVFAAKIRHHLWPALRDCAERAVPMIGVCNGFQVMAQCGLLPGFMPGEWPEHAPPPTVALASNSSARFIDAWPHVEIPGDSVCIWTKGVEESLTPDTARLPVAHGEGRFVAADVEVLERLKDNRQIAVRYIDNFNGSEDAIAGICDPAGRIFGLMPHPERYLDWRRHPYWTRLGAEVTRGEAPGLAMFRRAVAMRTAAGV